MNEFEALLRQHRLAVEHYVRFRLDSEADAEDVLQETWLAACSKFSQLKNTGSFKPWILSIAKNKCADYYRRKAGLQEIPLELLSEADLPKSRCGIREISIVQETVSLLGKQDRQILELYFWKELSYAEIAFLLKIPVGTVKSRLHTAKQHFKNRYPHPAAAMKGDLSMKTLPDHLPAYTIRHLDLPPFSVKWEELMGWFLVPKEGEKLIWKMYDSATGRCRECFDLAVTGKARVHGIEGVEICVRETICEEDNREIHWRFVAQLTDTHCRQLAVSFRDGEVNNYYTFLDGEEFAENWGFGPDNCGNETNLSPKGDIHRNGSMITCAGKSFLLDIVGRYEVSVNGKVYDTICVMDVETYNEGVVSEQYLDKNGRTVLWRRFNRDACPGDQCQKPWSQLLPNNEKITVNGSTFVHWYDCITDYIL